MIEDIVQKLYYSVPAYLVGVILSLLGGYDRFLEMLLTCIVLDLFTGLVKAWLNQSEKSTFGGLDSSAFRAGISRKVLYFVIIALCVILDKIFGTGESMRTLSIVWYTATEGLSIVENVGACGAPVPKWIRVRLDKLKEDEEKVS